MTDSADVVFYYRNGCHLCEELAALLFSHWPGLAESIEWRDVDSSPEWVDAYGLRVPVLLRGDQLVSELKPDPEQLARCFGKAANQL